MGTRNLTKVIDRNGVLKVAQYGQWDGYPSGQGVNALVHAFNFMAIEKGLERVRFASEAECEEIYAKFPEMNYFGTQDSKNFGLMYPNLVRDTCANILGVVAWSVGEVILVDNSDFEQDELFCEGVYTIDFQKGKFISTYGGRTIEYDLDNLPYQNEYVEAWNR